MAKIINPISFSEHFKLNNNELENIRILNPILNIDTKLFIDPVLLSQSSFDEISNGGEQRFQNFFAEMIKILSSSITNQDVAWREAVRRFTFREVKETCLGYGAATIHGSALGAALRIKLLSTAKQIVDLGIADPDLFKLLPLLEEGMGPDRISDIASRVIFPDLAALTQRICSELQIPCCPQRINGEIFNLPINPTEKKPTSILLIPLDILRDLPIASNWSEIADTSSKNKEIRDRVNLLIGNIWKARTRKDKAQLRSRAMDSRKAFESLLDLIKNAEAKPYNSQADPSGLLTWQKLRQTVANDFPLKIDIPIAPSDESDIDIVNKIVDQFQNLIEEKGLWKLLWINGKPHHEHVPQMIFFAIADAYCKANNLDLTPEADTGNGPVDFKISRGYTRRILLEIKLSRNSKLVHGFECQLERYRKSQNPIYSVFLIIDVGGLGRKHEQVQKIWNDLSSDEKKKSRIILVDGRRQLSASRLSSVRHN